MPPWPNLPRHPLHLEPLPWPTEPEHAMAHLAREQQECLWLSSCWPVYQATASRDILAGGFNAYVTAKPHYTLSYGDQHHKSLAECPVKWLYQQLHDDDQIPAHIACPGWYGGLSYNAAHERVGLKQPVKSSQWPSVQLGFASWVITLDFQRKEAWLVYSNTRPHIPTWPTAPLDQPISIGPWRAHMTKAEYTRAFHNIKRHLYEGDSYQVNFAQQFTASYTGEPLQGFLKLKQTSPCPYSAFWKTIHGTVSCHSPELFLQVDQQPYRMTSKPIKGTTPRLKDQQQDRQRARDLHASIKNRAENTMIVDLLRNDMSKHSIPLTMKVKSLCAIESFAHVHHLVSDIETQLQPDTCLMDAVLDCFPGGSITGAPKRRSMEIIDALEPTPRDIYCGSIGFWDRPKQGLFNIAIRTLLFLPELNSVRIWAGGGIVIDSEAEDEYQECFHKVLKLMQCLQPENTT